MNWRWILSFVLAIGFVIVFAAIAVGLLAGTVHHVLLGWILVTVSFFGVPAAFTVFLNDGELPTWELFGAVMGGWIGLIALIVLFAVLMTLMATI